MPAILFALALALGAAPGEIEVVDQSGQPIHGAVLTLLPAEVEGEALQLVLDEGRGRPAGTGTFEYTIEADGFVTASGTLLLPDDLAQDGRTLRMVRAAGLAGRILDHRGRPLPQAGLAVLPPGGEGVRSSLRTDDSGGFAAGGLEPGLVRLRASAEGHLSETIEGVPLVGGRTTVREFRLQPIARVRLVVRDAGGEPLKGARVSVVTDGDDGLRLGEKWAGRLEELEADTAGDGSAELGGLPRGRPLRLAVSHPAYAPLSLRLVPETVEIEAEARLHRGGSIRALIHDAAREPVPGARIHLAAARVEDLDLVGEPAPSGDDGLLSLSRLPAGTYVLRIQAAGLRPLTLREVAVGEGETTDLGSLEMSPGSVLAGRVLDPGDEPVSGATVTATFFEAGREMEEECETDAKGRFRIEGLPPRTADLEIRAEGFAREVLPRVTAGTEDLVLRLKRTGSATGRVVDASTGAPVVSFRVTPAPDAQDGAKPPSRARRRGEGNGTASAEGRFQLEDLTEGRWIAHVGADGYRPASSRPFEVTSGRETDVGEVALEPGLSLEGRVESAGDGTPVAGATVGVGGLGPLGRASGVLTDADGNFRLDGLDSPTALQVTHPDFVTRKLPDVEVADSPFLVVRLEKGGRAEGTVWGEDGEPLPGAEVRAKLKGSVTDADGRYALEGLTPGPVSLTKTDLPGTVRGQDRVVVQIRAGETTRHDFGAGARLSGRLTWRNSPAPGARLTLWEVAAAGETGEYRADRLRSRETGTREDGSYIFTGLGEGSYTLLVQWEGRRFGRDLRMGGDSTTLDLAVPDLEISGRVVVEGTGEPVGGAEVVAILQEEDRPVSISIDGRGGGNMSMWATAPVATDLTDTEGRFRLPVGQAGAWGLSARKEGFSMPRDAEPLVFKVEEAVRDVVVRLKGSSSLSVRIVDAATDGPLLSGFAQLRQGAGMMMVMNVDASGAVFFPEVSPGEIEITGTVEAFAPEWRTLDIEAGEAREEVLALDRGGTLRVLLPPGLEATPDALRDSGLRISAWDGTDLTMRLLGLFTGGPPDLGPEPGVARFSHVPDGLITVRLGGEGTSLPEQSVEVAVPLGGDASADLR